MQIGAQEWRKVIGDGAKQLGIDLPPAAPDQFGRHARELLRWNSKINLTAITDPLGMAVKHYIDCLAPAALIPPRSALLDIGSGAGFPGIPLKIIRPSLKLTAIDATRKKVSFLNHVGHLLRLDNYHVCHQRLDRGHQIAKRRGQGLELGRIESAMAAAIGTFDVVISRALAPLDVYLAMALPYVAPEGMILVMKGRVDASEPATVRKILAAARPALAAAAEVTTWRYRLPVFNDERSIVRIALGQMATDRSSKRRSIR